MRILYLDLDSCRPDHLGCYGYHRNTSPHIDAIARQAMIFNGCHTSDAPCLPSRTALYSGRFGIHTGVVGHGGTAASPKNEGPRRDFSDSFVRQGLARQLQRLGLHTAMISPFGQRHGAHWFYAGFNEIHNSGGGGVESAGDVWPSIETWLDHKASADNWFLHVNFWDIHTPYRVPLDYGEPFADAPLPPWLEAGAEAIIARHNRLTGPHSSLDLDMYGDRENPAFPRSPGAIRNRHDLRRVFNGYDTGIRYVDDHVGRIVAKLKAAGLYDDTAIIISADHGENLGELGLYSEHGTADAATCRVPLIIKWPGGSQGVNSKFHYNIDLAPTLMELLGGEHQPLWDGASFAPAVRTGDASAGRDEIVFSQCAHVCQRAVRWENWLYLRTYHDGFHLFPQEMLFDLARDPHEQNDLAAQHPGLLREGAWRLARWHDAQMQRMALHSDDVTDPLWTVIREGGPFHARLIHPGNPGGPEEFNHYLTRLEATGRADGAAVLRDRYLTRTVSFPDTP
jgi:arylsulfatase A-like enzyme